MNTWRYELRPTNEGGADVTESFDLGDNLFTKFWRPLGGLLRERRDRRDMLRTLEWVKAVAEGARIAAVKPFSGAQRQAPSTAAATGGPRVTRSSVANQ